MGRSIVDTWLRLVHHRDLLWSLTGRELKARYRGSALGFFWSLINPLLLLLVYALVFGALVARGDLGPRPYVLFLLTGLFPWLWVSAAVLEGTVSLSTNAGLIRKAVFPLELLPVVSVLAHLAHFALALPVLLLALAFGRLRGYPVLGASALLVPAVVALQLLLLTGVALGLAALHVHFKDVRDALANVLQLVFFSAPILYPLELVRSSALHLLVQANPITPFTLAYQQLLFEARVPDARVWLVMAAVALAGLLCGTALFARLADTLVEAV